MKQVAEIYDAYDMEKYILDTKILSKNFTPIYHKVLQIMRRESSKEIYYLQDLARQKKIYENVLPILATQKRMQGVIS